MGDRTLISREQWPPSSSAADRRRPLARFPGDSQRQHAHSPSEAPSNNRVTERAPLWSTWSATDTGLQPKPRTHRKRVRAEDLWDRDEEELLQRRATELASADVGAGAGAGEEPQMSQPEYVVPSGMGQDLHGSGGPGDDLLHSDPVEGREQKYTRPEPDSLNHAEDNIPSGSPESKSHRQAYTQVESDALNYTEDSIPSRSTESQSHQRVYTRPEVDALTYAEHKIPSRSPRSQSRQQAYTQPEVDALQYADHNIPSRSPMSQNHLDLKRPRDRYLDDFSTMGDAELEPQKRRRKKAGHTQPSTMDNDLAHKKSQDALIDALLEKLADEQGKTRAVKQELKRLKHHQGAAEKVKKQTKQNKGKKKAAATQKGKEKSGQTHQTRLSANIPSARKATGDSGHVGKHRQTDQAGRTHETLLSDDTPFLKEERNDTGRLATFTKFESLPDNVQDMIFCMLLESPDPIKLNTARLVEFVRTNGGIPYSISSTRRLKRRTNVLEPPHDLRLELDNMKADLSQIPLDRWPAESVARGLTISLLFVSKAVHRKAARCFYGNNVFEFSDARDAWLHLESFLNTICPENVSNMQQLSVAMPNWFHDLASDRVAVALLEAFSPITRLAAVTNAAEAPLPSAISSCASILADHTGLKSFQINISLCEIQSFLNPTHPPLKQQTSKQEKAIKAKRRHDSVPLLCALIDSLRPRCKMEFVIHTDHESNKKREKFDKNLPRLLSQAEKYGLEVNRVLDVREKLKAYGDV